MLKDQLINPMMTAKLSKIRDSAVELSSLPGTITVIPDTVKETMVSELREIEKYVADTAFEYYSEHDFEVTPQIITIMRSVVMSHYERV